MIENILHGRNVSASDISYFIRVFTFAEIKKTLKFKMAVAFLFIGRYNPHPLKRKGYIRNEKKENEKAYTACGG